MVCCKGILQRSAVFLVWTLTSFLCHKLAKMAMNVYLDDPQTSLFVLPLTVTLSQTACCLAVVQMPWNSPLHPLLLVSHFLATLATNSSMALTFASSTLAIKMLEPASSAVMQKVVLKTPVSRYSVLGLLLVVGGAVTYVGSPWMDEAVAPAVVLAFLSNVILGVRNVTVKLYHQKHHDDDDYTLKSWSSLTKFFICIVAHLLLSYCLETYVRILRANATYFLSLVLASGACHVTYSYVSMKLVLNDLSVLSHALANIFKRVLVVLLLHVTGRRVASFWNWAGLMFCMVGMYLYQRDKLSTLDTLRSPKETLSQRIEPHQKKEKTVFVM